MSMAINKTEDRKEDFKESLERKFNETTVKVAETKLFLLDALARSVNITADKILSAKQHAKHTKETLLAKMGASFDQTVQRLGEMKKEIRDYKESKKHNHDGQFVYVTRDFLLAPVFPIELPTSPSTVATSEETPLILTVDV